MMSSGTLVVEGVEEDAPGMIEDLASVYAFRDGASVRTFLRTNPDLLPILRAIPDRVAPYLPADRRLILEVVVDPEDEESRPELFALIPTRLDPEKALARLGSLRREWWLGAYREAGGRLNIDVEYP
jgi:hypothetical protein